MSYLPLDTERFGESCITMSSSRVFTGILFVAIILTKIYACFICDGHVENSVSGVASFITTDEQLQ